MSLQHRVAPYLYLGWPVVPADFGHAGRAVADVETCEFLDWQLPRHLRSLRGLGHYQLEAVDGEAGHVEDWLVDLGDWRVPYAVVRVPGALHRRHVLVPVVWLGNIRWTARAVLADLPREAVVRAPDYEPGHPPDADYQNRLRGWYGSPIRSEGGATRPAAAVRRLRRGGASSS